VKGAVWPVFLGSLEVITKIKKKVEAAETPI
jgi:hypothetical protein